jgi:S-adenosylmethionine:tRNA ribosyltransferase-isomerase
VATDYVTLHVGAGTFKPVKAETIGEHHMHAEFIDVLLTTIEHLLAHIDRNIIAVGTTSVRTLESLYWMGVKVAENNNISMEELEVQQWEPYDKEEMISAKSALKHLQNWMKKNSMQRLLSKTQIIIAPGYQLRIVKAVVTNFHQPQSTLLLLIAAFTGSAWKDIYQYALDNDFRFLSYGDGCLLWASDDYK